jgi:thioredoxin 1
MILSVNEKNFSQVVLESSDPVLVHFLAPWCGLCRLVLPSLRKFQTESGGQIKIININADENLKLASRYRLKSLPTLILFENSQATYRLEGFNRRDELEKNLNSIAANYWVRSA